MSLRRVFGWLAAAMLLVPFARADGLPTQAASLSFSFTPNAATVSTSEGAPYGDADFWPAKRPGVTAYGYGPTKVVRLYICLSGEVTIGQCSAQPAVTGPLSPQMLSGIDTRLAAYVGTGIRIMPRFTYNFGPIGPGAKDAPISVIATHIDQLAPILQKYRDIMFALEAGFIGTWGEWHDSTNGNDTDAAQAVVIGKELHYFQGEFPVLVRRPSYAIAYFNSMVPSPALGLHDDYYDSSPTDAGTWIPVTGITTAGLQSYAAMVATRAMFVGEFGALDPALQSCAALDAYSTRFHVQSISLFIHPATIGALLVQEGCATSFFNKVGTRIEIEKAMIAPAPARGGQIDVTLTLADTGYGRVIRARPVWLVFRSADGAVARIPVPLATLDLRLLGATPTTFAFRVTLPCRLPPGRVTLGLLIPDPAPSLSRQSAYALPLNSLNEKGAAIFDPATGLNQIGMFRDWHPSPAGARPVRAACRAD